ncbi:MAG: hypothetical protein HW416_3813 [Chloroflexi bacterium]|nr:hypothetical protein [Chloroflexota bacterium]
MPSKRPVNRQTALIRSRFVLETASELVGDDNWPYKQAVVYLREQGADGWKIGLFGSDAPDGIEDVTSGRVQVAIVNPSVTLAMAYRGTGSFKQPHPWLRAISVLPQFDQLGMAVAESTGLTSLADIRDRRYPLRISMRGQADHNVHRVCTQVFDAMDFSFEDIVSWGGEVRYDSELPNGPNRIGAVERGEIDAIFDEATTMWVNRGLDLGMRFLSIDDSCLRQLEDVGFRRVAMPLDDFPKMPRDVWTVDFSGWPVFTREEVPDSIIRAFCEALEIRKDRIPYWYGSGPLRLDLMCKDTREGPLMIPLHPAAEAFWHEQGYL